MKTYLLSLITSDFSKNGKIWSTAGIDLYANKYYTNYSYTRSTTGLNSLSDYIFTGTEIISDATPTISGALYVTDYRRNCKRSQYRGILCI
jgi:hypothetical protein